MRSIAPEQVSRIARHRFLPKCQAPSPSLPKYYENLGYIVHSVEKDNIGWDLEARPGNRLILRLEVKGLSQDNVVIEMTPNEYLQMKKHEDSYRICVVTNALSKSRTLWIFSFSRETGRWEDEGGNQLKIKKMIAARMKL